MRWGTKDEENQVENEAEDEEDDGDGKEDNVQVREGKVEDDDKLLENGSDAPAAPLVEPPGRDNGTMEGR